MGRPDSYTFLDESVEHGLFNRREPTRVMALTKIIKAFANNTEHETAQKKFATIMLRCLHMVKKGSAMEISLATKAMGLLAMVIGYGDNAHELYEESLTTYSECLKFKDEFVKVLESLAIVTLVGARDFYETEKSMKFIWQFIHPNSGCNIISNKKSAPVLAAAISAWSFLLTTIDVQTLDNKYWQGAISDLLNLLEEGKSVCAASVEALAIIFEKGCVEKFSSEVYKTIFHSVIDTTSFIQEWKDKIIVQVNKVCKPEWEFSKFFEDDYSLERSMYISGNDLTFSTLSKLKKMKFLKEFLGDGFEMHMMENELLHHVFDFVPKDDPSGPELYIPEIEKLNFRYFIPVKQKCTQRFEKSPNSPMSKAKTKLLKKQRMQAQERKMGGLDLLA